MRRSRRRFWRTDPDAPAGDTLAAQATLHEMLTTLSLLLAPLCPFVSDTMWRHLTGPATATARWRSVHLADWPTADGSDSGPADPELEAQMALARRLTSLGRAARSEASVKVRQPLRRALVFLPADAPEILRDIVADELNVDEIDTAEELSEVIQFELVPNFRTLGARLRELVKELQAGAGRPRQRRRRRGARRRDDPITVTLGGQTVELSPDDVQLRVRGQQGFAVSREGGEVVALDLNLDEGLRKRGLSRDVVRLVQDLRKASGLEVSDRIRLSRGGPRRHRRVLRLHRPRGAGGGDRQPVPARGRGPSSSSTTSCSPSRCGSGSSGSSRSWGDALWALVPDPRSAGNHLREYLTVLPASQYAQVHA